VLGLQQGGSHAIDTAAHGSLIEAALAPLAIAGLRRTPVPDTGTDPELAALLLRGVFCGAMAESH